MSFRNCLFFTSYYPLRTPWQFLLNMAWHLNTDLTSFARCLSAHLHSCVSLSSFCLFCFFPMVYTVMDFSKHKILSSKLDIFYHAQQLMCNILSLFTNNVAVLALVSKYSTNIHTIAMYLIFFSTIAKIWSMLLLLVNNWQYVVVTFKENVSALLLWENKFRHIFIT